MDYNLPTTLKAPTLLIKVNMRKISHGLILNLSQHMDYRKERRMGVNIGWLALVCYELEFALHEIFYLILTTTLKDIIFISILQITEVQG